MKILKRIIFVLIMITVAAVYSYGVWPRAIYNTNVGANSYENTGALQANDKIEQFFTCQNNGLNGLTIKLTKMDNQLIGTYEWQIREQQSGEVIGEGIIDESSTESKQFVSSSAQKRGNVTLDLPRQESSKGKQYVLTIQGKDVDDTETMAVYITEKNQTESELTVAGKTLEKASVIKLSYKRFNIETFIVFLAIIAYLAAFVKFMYRLFR